MTAPAQGSVPRSQKPLSSVQLCVMPDMLGSKGDSAFLSLGVGSLSTVSAFQPVTKWTYFKYTECFDVLCCTGNILSRFSLPTVLPFLLLCLSHWKLYYIQVSAFFSSLLHFLGIYLELRLSGSLDAPLHGKQCSYTPLIKTVPGMSTKFVPVLHSFLVYIVSIDF